MKRIGLLILLGCGSSLLSFEPPQSVKKEKDRESASSSSSSSGSKGQISTSFNNVPLDDLDMNKMDTSRMEQDGKVVISSEEELNKMLQKRGINLDTMKQEEKRISIVYMPPSLNLAAITRDTSNQSRSRKTPDLERGPDVRPHYDQEAEEETFDKEFAFFVEYMREKTKNPKLNLKSVESELKKDFRNAHNTPPSTPHDTPEAKDLQKKKKTVEALRKASIYQETAREHRLQNIPRSPALEKAREPRALEILHTFFTDKDVHDSLEGLKDEIIGLLAEKNDKTQTSLTNTRYGGTLVGLVVSGLTAIITYLGTKKSC